MYNLPFVWEGQKKEKQRGSGLKSADTAVNWVVTGGKSKNDTALQERMAGGPTITNKHELGGRATLWTNRSRGILVHRPTKTGREKKKNGENRCWQTRNTEQHSFATKQLGEKKNEGTIN